MSGDLNSPEKTISDDDEDPTLTSLELLNEIAHDALDEDPESISLELLKEIVTDAIKTYENDPKNICQATLQEISDTIADDHDPELISQEYISDVLNKIDALIKPDESSHESIEITKKSVDKLIAQPALDSLVDEAVENPELLCKEILNDIINDIPVDTDGSNIKLQQLLELEKELMIGEMIEEHTEEEQEEEDDELLCQEFDDPEEVARAVVDKTIQDTTEYLLTHASPSNQRIKTNQSQEEEEEEEEQLEEEESEDEPDVQYFEKVDQLEWPTVEAFTIELGMNAIYDFLETWYIAEDWLYCVNHLGCQSDQCVDYYYYQAIWSIPTPAYPIPQATASVYFTIHVSRVVPKTCKVKVTYQFEGTRFVHKPGKIDFNEDWLFYIIDSKINLFKTLDF